MQSNAELTSQVFKNAAKILNTKGRMEVAKSTKTVVVNKSANPHKIRDCGFFFLI
mgnify:CR=1 FL=1